MESLESFSSAIPSPSAECSLQQRCRKRRHSFSLPRRKSLIDKIMDGEEMVLLQVDVFLSELERRLDFIERYGELTIDSSISRAFSTLQAVRSQCSQASQGVLDAGRCRLQLMVDTVDARYHEALAATESVHEKARVGIDLLEGMLSEFEMKAYKFRDRGLATAADAAGAFMDEGRRVVDEGIERAIRAAETLEEHIQTAVGRAREKGLILYEDLPIPWRNNPDIIRGYRFTESKIDCVRSVFGFSNESFNIWSHALGLVVVLAVAFNLYPSSLNFSLSSRADVLIAAIFFLMACGTLACSTVWHTMNAISDVKAISTFACIDYTGISLLVAASIVTTEYTAFYCDPLSRWAYISATALFGSFGVILAWHPRFNGQDMAWARVSFYVGLALTGFLPILQLYMTHGPDFVYAFYWLVSKSLFIYLCGAVVYASRIPERWFPGMFDYCGGSHNLWHVAVLGGIFFHYVAMQDFFSNAFRRAAIEECPAY